MSLVSHMMPLVSRANFDKKKNVVSKSYDVTGKIKYAHGKSYDALGKPDHLRYDRVCPR